MATFQNGSTATTQIGYVNRNNQRCCGHTGEQGTDHLQFAYKMECLNRECGHIYWANGSDVFQRRCPACQGGKNSLQQPKEITSTKLNQTGTNHQRRDADSNTQAGNQFEEAALKYFREQENLALHRNHQLQIGAANITKARRFDLGSNEPPILVECKSHRWTESGNMPSAKVTVWNEAMYYFHLAPREYRKVLFVLRDQRNGSGESLANYYIRNYEHLIPHGVEILELDLNKNTATKIK